MADLIQMSPGAIQTIVAARVTEYAAEADKLKREALRLEKENASLRSTAERQRRWIAELTKQKRHEAAEKARYRILSEPYAPLIAVRWAVALSVGAMAFMAMMEIGGRIW